MADDDALDIRLLDTAVELMGRSGVRGSLRVRGESMTPTLRPDDVIAVDFSRRSFRRGDILLFRQVDYLTVHRLLGAARFPDGRPCLRTRGDGRHRLDPPLDRSDVHGRVFAVMRGGGWRDMGCRRARCYAWALAFHDLAWASAGVLAARLDRWIGRAGSERSLETATAFVDQKVLGLVHRLVFSWGHPRIEPPGDLGGVPEREPHSP